MVILWSFTFLLGILTQRWRLLLRPVVADAEKCTVLVKAMCVLHNYLRTVNDVNYTPLGYVDHTTPAGEIREGFWRQQAVPPLQGLGVTARSATTAAMTIRNRFAEYFSGAGALDWQLDHINRRQ